MRPPTGADQARRPLAIAATFTLPWPPSVNAAYRSIVVGRSPRVLISRNGREYKQAAAHAIMLQRVPSFGDQRVSVSLSVYPPDRRKRDLGNLDKLLIDALMPQVIDDDSQIDKLTWERMRVIPGGEVTVTVAAIRPPGD